MKKRLPIVILDTNVIISAMATPKGAAGRLYLPLLAFRQHNHIAAHPKPAPRFIRPRHQAISVQHNQAERTQRHSLTLCPVGDGLQRVAGQVGRFL